MISRVFSFSKLVARAALLFVLAGGFTLSGNAADPFGTALNAPTFVWTTGGDASWFVQTTNSHQGLSAGRSGAIGDSEESWIATEVTGPGILTFWWSVSSESGYDWLRFYVDGDERAAITEDTGWKFIALPLGPGLHALKWTYSKDDSNADGIDAGFLDQVSFGIGNPPVITVNPFNQTNYPGNNVVLLAGATSNVAITWEWYKVGDNRLIPGATNQLFTPADSGTPDVAGTYFAIAYNMYGATATAQATVSFAEGSLPVTLVNPQFPGGAFQIQFLSQPGFTYAVQCRTNLIAGSGWQTCTNVTGNGSLKTVLLPPATFHPSRQGFVRILNQ